MLREEVIKELREKIKDINKEKNIEERLNKMIILLNDVRSRVNDELDDIFSAVNLRKRKLNLSEDDNL
jgi:predicted nucleic acid-binding protein